MGRESIIKNVWKDNLEEEIFIIRHLLKKYRYVAMDTEFPGVISKPIGIFKNQASYNYHQLRINVNILNLIQLGISISDEQGNRPEPIHTWQFNFEFDLEKDMYSQDSIELLVTAKIDFREHLERGIDISRFGSLLYTSGLIGSGDVVWISFHSSYDFGYLLKMVTGNFLQDNEEDFNKYMKVFFPHFYDLKYLLKNTEHIRKGLQDISNELGVTRDGIAHQAGSDSLLTSLVFFKLLETMLAGIDIRQMKSKLFGMVYMSDAE